MTAAPPSTPRRSSTHTDSPAPARYAAQVSPLWPPPMMTASKRASARLMSVCARAIVRRGFARSASRPPAGGFSRRSMPGRDGRESAVDVRDLAGDRAREIGQQERRDVADLVGRDVAAQRRVRFDEMLDLREAADAGRRERLDRPGRNAVDADALGTEAGREVADVRFEARLGETHHVVVRQRAQRAEVRERQQRAVSPLHQRPRALGERREAVRAHVVRHRERRARHAVQEIAGERLARRERDRVQQPSSAPHSALERSEQRGDVVVLVTSHGSTGTVPNRRRA